MIPVIGPVIGGIGKTIISTTWGKVLVGALGIKATSDVIGVAKNFNDATKGISKKVINVGKKTVEIASDTAHMLNIKKDIFLKEHNINNVKYEIGKYMFEKNINFDDENIKNIFTKIERYEAEINDLEKEYGIAGGDVNELKNEIMKNNEQFAIMEKEKEEVINYVENVKSEVALSINDRHKSAEEYIKQVLNETKEMDEVVDADELISRLDEM